MADDTDPAFADAFPRADEAQWRALVARVLKGAPFERLVSKTADGLAIEPLYQSLRDERPRAIRAAPGDWAIAARVDHPDPREAGRLALADLEGGANALHVVFQGAVGAHGFGLPADSGALGTALEGVHLDAGVKIALEPGESFAPAARALAAIVADRAIDPASLSIDFGFDPLGQAALGGGAPAPWSEIARDLGREAKALADAGFSGRFCVADGRVTHAAGGTEAQELAFTLAAALAYWRALEAGGIEAGAARSMLSFRMAADADEFLTIAKFRALRRLWARVEDAAGFSPEPVHVHAETAWRMMTRRDPHVNLLRATVACFSAGLGAADVVSVLPFTQALGLPDALARRLARNTQLLLLEESNLGRVADPVAGAGVFEALTDALCEKAWDLFREIETASGLFAALSSGAFQDKVSLAREARRKAVATRRAPLTGTSEFPNIHEAPAAVLATSPPPAETPSAPCPFAALAPARDGEAFELLRDAADARATRPKIFLACLGPLPAFSARAGFAKNLFEAGGFEAPANDGFADDAALSDAFRKSGARIACLCSSDEIYATRAGDAARALAAAGAAQIWLAGRPGDAEAALRTAGVTGFVFAGRDVIAALQEAVSIA